MYLDGHKNLSAVFKSKQTLGMLPVTFERSIWSGAFGAERNSGISPYQLLILIFNLSVFELVGFQTKLFKDLWYIYFHAVKVFSMFFPSSLDLCSAHCEGVPWACSKNWIFLKNVFCTSKFEISMFFGLLENCQFWPLSFGSA